MVGPLLSPFYLLIPKCFLNYLPLNLRSPMVSSSNGGFFETSSQSNHHDFRIKWMRQPNRISFPVIEATINDGDSKRPPSLVTSSAVEKEKWRKVLYERQGVPDNYVPSTFLNDLRKNVNLRRFHLMEAIIAASIVVQQITLIVIMVLMFIYFDRYQNHYDFVLFTVVALVTLFLYSIIFLSFKFQELIQFKSCLIFLMACFTMSPILKTLTETISTDTIYTHCTLMAIIHLAFHDFGLKAAAVSRPISLNAIFFASVCLASRLSTTFHAFAFLIFSLDLFVLIESMYKTLSWRAKLLVTANFIIVTLALIAATFGTIGFLVAISCFTFINILCPYIFYRMQSMKANIYGPWDEAIIDQSKLAFTTTAANHCGNENHVVQQTKLKKHRRKMHKRLDLASGADQLVTIRATTDHNATMMANVDFF